MGRSAFHYAEKDEDFERLARLPFVAEISPLSRLLLPSSFQSDRELRQAAERVQADMLVVYTVDTTFLDTDESTPVTVISLGLMPTVDVRVVTTVSALLLDTQTGYVYATTEQIVHEQVTTGALSTRNAFDTLRLKTERRAFEDFLDEFETRWPRIVETYKKWRIGCSQLQPTREIVFAQLTAQLRLTDATAGFILPDMSDPPDKSAGRNEAGEPQTVGDILASALKLEDQISSGAYEDYMKPENWPERLDEGIFLLIRKHLATLVTDTQRHRETLLALVQEYGQDG